MVKIFWDLLWAALDESNPLPCSLVFICYRTTQHSRGLSARIFLVFSGCASIKGRWGLECPWVHQGSNQRPRVPQGDLKAKLAGGFGVFYPRSLYISIRVSSLWRVWSRAGKMSRVALAQWEPRCSPKCTGNRSATLSWTHTQIFRKKFEVQAT